jgi:hypothetical protein
MRETFLFGVNFLNRSSVQTRVRLIKVISRGQREDSFVL